MTRSKNIRNTGFLAFFVAFLRQKLRTKHRILRQFPENLEFWIFRFKKYIKFYDKSHKSHIFNFQKFFLWFANCVQNTEFYDNLLKIFKFCTFTLNFTTNCRKSRNTPDFTKNYTKSQKMKIFFRFAYKTLYLTTIFGKFEFQISEKKIHWTLRQITQISFLNFLKMFCDSQIAYKTLNFTIFLEKKFFLTFCTEFHDKLQKTP